MQRDLDVAANARAAQEAQLEEARNLEEIKRLRKSVAPADGGDLSERGFFLPVFDLGNKKLYCCCNIWHNCFDTPMSGNHTLPSAVGNEGCLKFIVSDQRDTLPELTDDSMNDGVFQTKRPTGKVIVVRYARKILDVKSGNGLTFIPLDLVLSKIAWDKVPWSIAREKGFAGFDQTRPVHWKLPVTVAQGDTFIY